jgi:membrane protein required for colicin V production
LNWVDFAIIAVIVWFTFASLRAGFIREAAALSGAILGVILAGQFYQRLAADIEVFIDDARAAEVSAFIIIFGATLLGAQMIALFLKRAASLLMLGPLDAMGGGVLGFLKGFVIVEFLLIAATTFPTLHMQQDVADSSFAPFFLNLVPVLTLLLPEEFEQAIDAFQS